MNRNTVLWTIPSVLVLFLLNVGCGQKKEERSIADLVGALKANDEAARIMAAEGLGEQGRAEPAQAVPALTEALKDPSAIVRQTAVKALAQIGGRTVGRQRTRQAESAGPDAQLLTADRQRICAGQNGACPCLRAPKHVRRRPEPRTAPIVTYENACVCFKQTLNQLPTVPQPFAAGPRQHNESARTLGGGNRRGPPLFAAANRDAGRDSVFDHRPRQFDCLTFSRQSQ